MKEQVDIKTIFRILKRRIATILVTTIFVSLLSGAIVFYVMKPTYEAKEYVLVGNLESDGEVYIDPQTINRLIASTVDFITSPIVLETVQAETGLSREELEESITIQNKENSQIVSIVIRNTDPEQASKLAQLLASTSVEELKESLQMENITMLSEGKNNLEQVGNPIVNLLIGIMAGLFCGIGLAMLKEQWDDSVQSSSQIEEELGLPVFGEVAATKNELPKIYQKRFNTANTNVKKGGGVHAESH